jgi:hypothetical protein
VVVDEESLMDRAILMVNHTLMTTSAMWIMTTLRVWQHQALHRADQRMRVWMMIDAVVTAIAMQPMDVVLMLVPWVYEDDDSVKTDDWSHL